MSRRMLFLWVAVAAAAQQVEPVYRTGTRLVQVDVVVRNDKGPVKGLTKDDFTIQDKGKAQTISVFTMNETRGDAAKPTPLPPGVASNRIGSGGESAQNATVIVFDRLNIAETQSSTSNSSSSTSSGTSGTLSGAQARAGQQVLQVLTSLKVPEKVGLYSLFQDLKVVRDFTDDSQPLMEAAKRATASPQKTGATPAEQVLDAKLRDALTPGYPLDRSVRAEVTEKAFRAIARRMAGVPGRKSLIWITSSFPLTYGDDPNHQAESSAEVNGIATLLGDANIALYSIDPRGAGTAFSQSNSATSDDASSGGGKGGKGGGKGMRSLDSSAPTNGLSGVESMQLIAEQTGGKAFINVNDIAPPIREVIDSSEVSYTLGFYVDDKALDGKKHEVSVKVSKKPEASGAKLSYRKSYMAAAQKEHPQMDELVADKLDANRIGVMAAAAPAPNRPGIDAVQVRVEVKDLQFEKRADKWFTSFDLALALEAGGEPKISTSPKSLSLSDDQLRQALAGGVTIDNTVPAPDKAATLRVVIQDKATGEAGSVRIPLPGK